MLNNRLQDKAWCFSTKIYLVFTRMIKFRNPKISYTTKSITNTTQDL